MSMTRKLFIGVVALVVLICIGIWIAGCILAERARVEAQKAWRVIPQQEWPEALLDLHREAERRHVHLGETTVLHKAYSGEYLWKCDTSAELLDLMVARWKLSPVNQHHKLVLLVLERMPSDFLSSIQSDDVAYYISANWLAGEKGHWYCVLNDKTQKRMIVRYYYNF